MPKRQVFAAIGRHLARFAAKKAEAARRDAAGLASDMAKTGLASLIVLFALLVLAGAIAVQAIEGARGNESFKGPFEGFWWAVVTIATVGYGDAYPASQAGRAVAMAFILFGFVLSALISGTIASIFVERRIREGKGLRDLKVKGHLALCGWNHNAVKILAALERDGSGRRTVLVLVNGREGDWFDSLKAEHPDLDLKYVRGNFWDESALVRASVATAKAVIILADESSGEGPTNADERSLLAALTCQSLNPAVPVSAEALREESAGHLRRAGVDNVVVNGEFSPFLEASEHFMKSGSGLMVGLLSEEKSVSLDDLLSDDPSAIDAFIKRKFKESAIDLGSDDSSGREIELNPGPGRIIRESDSAFVLG